ncbi:PREDICTED: peroxisomal biogenesis factor 19-like [Priapulus caudatus]|uniref:Peroxin-19 n=1 Tax=Priapulus caudatus TaxID=37621 RepID=A0ABM1EQF7_PRICU|nr:PREDICTED: peroxisomal biogenesis factor 19-like [Priapulus caudatus]
MESADSEVPKTPTCDSNTATQTDNKLTNSDKELDALLDSALEGFDQPIPTEPTGETTSASPGEAQAEGSNAEATFDTGALFKELFEAESATQASEQFEKAMQYLMVDEPELGEQFQKLTKSAQKAGSSPEANKEFAESLSGTLNSLAQDAKSLQTEFSETDILDAMNNLGVGGSEGGASDPFMPMMQGLMRNLLSKDVLYPSLKEISSKYPAWLEAKKGVIDQAEHDKYSKQCELMVTICTDYEAETPGDSDQVKQERFERVMTIMQEMQELGHPPTDITGETGGIPGMAEPALGGLQFDEHGMPKLPPGMEEQCSVM